MQFLNSYSDKLIPSFIIYYSSIFSFFITSFGQRWVTTTAHTVTIMLLPFITFIITKVISGNIALSLGLVGALSIVRFRNPVRSPLELTVYFGSITLGIAASVRLDWLIAYTFGVLAICLGLFIVNKMYFKILNKNFFFTSFSEGNSFSTLEVVSNKEISKIENSKHLTVKNFNNKKFNYILSFAQFDDLMQVSNEIKNEESIISYCINR